jgi:hypothetical protein
VILVGQSGNLATVDPTSKALRVTLYDPQGREIVEKPATIRSYLAGFIIRHTGATTANTVLLGLVNTSTTDFMRIRCFRAIELFDGASPGAQGRRHFWTRTTGSISGSNTSITPTKKRTGDGASVADVQFNNTGIGGLAGVGDAVWIQSISIAATGNFEYFSWPQQSELRANGSPLELHKGEGLGLENGDAAVAGLGVAGYIEWDEGTL